MTIKPDPNIMKEFTRKLQKQSKDFREDLMNNFRDNELRRMEIIIDYLKDSFKAIGDRDFLLRGTEDGDLYISLDIQNGEEVCFSLIDANKSYDSGFLIEALLRELLRLWKIEKNKIKH